MINIGSSTISEMYIGSTKIKEAYIGDQLVYDSSKVIDLSLQDVYGNPINRSTANCYVVREAGQYKFPMVFGNAIKNGKVNTAAFTNNGGSYSHDFVDGHGDIITSPYLEPESGNIFRAANADCENLITDIYAEKEGDIYYINFTISDIPSSGGNIIINERYVTYPQWSWHIWLWPHDLSPVEITNSTGVKYNIMPVNLASKYDSDGVHIKNWFYQWGRPMPLLCPLAWNSTTNHYPGAIYKESKANYLMVGINTPIMFYHNSASPHNWFGTKSYYNLWDAACAGTGSSDNDTMKTVYDPCPVGWKVPNRNVFTGLSFLSDSNSIIKMRRYSGDTIGVEFPLSGYRDYQSGLLKHVGEYGCVWSSSAESQEYAYDFDFDFDNIDPNNSDYRSYGLSIRPVQDDLTKIDTI